MDHPFEHRAHYREDGSICHCPWGDPTRPDREREHVGSVKESSKLDWLRSRPDFQPDHKAYARNKHFLDFITKPQATPAPHEDDLPGIANENTDKLLPWLHREFKKGRLLPGWLIGSSDEKHPPHSVPHFRYKTDGSDWYPNDVIYEPEGLEEISEHGSRGVGPNGERIEENEIGAPLATHGAATGTRPLGIGDLERIQTAVEDMSKRGKGIDLMQHKVHELMPKIEDWQSAKEAEQRQHLGDIVHRFPDGWTIRQLRNTAEAQQEGNEMGHCVGTEAHGCPQRLRAGSGIFASLRDPKNIPHATIELTPSRYDSPNQSEHNDWEMESIPRVGPHSQSVQFYGKEDRAPEIEYENRVNEWLSHEGAPYANPGGGEADPQEPDLEEYEVPGAYDVERYLQSQDGGYMDWAYDDPEARIGENTQIYQGLHEWDNIARDYLGGAQRGQGRTPPADPKKRKEAFEAAMHEEQIPEFEEALYNNANESHQHLLEEWENWKQPYYHPLTGEFEEGWRPLNGEPKWKRELQNPLFKSLDENERKPVDENASAGQYVTNPDTGVMEWKWREGPWLAPKQEWRQYTSSVTRPLYYRWIFSPHKGVTVGTNQDDHPALVKYHPALSGEINDTDLVHGYAAPIGGGWRITDLEHRPVEDPYIVQQVVRRLNHEDPPQIRAEGSWRASEFDWDRIHYGLPQEIYDPS